MSILNDHDRKAREHRISALVNIANRTPQSAARIDDQSVEAVLAAFEVIQRIVDESPEDERPFIASQAYMMMQRTLAELINITRLMAEINLVDIGTKPHAEQAKSEPVMPRKDLR